MATGCHSRKFRMRADGLNPDVFVIDTEKVLLRERKRHTARRVASACYAALSHGWGVPPTIQTWSEGGTLSTPPPSRPGMGSPHHPDLGWGGTPDTPPHHLDLGWCTPPPSRPGQGGYPPPSKPEMGYPPTIQTWSGEYLRYTPTIQT